ncbi:MAG: hypothetical protein EOO03_02655 [Chitinophagaceae bacterium]|nr:MAG: hypothetical protein EOO03_02655 [Chitinophagaceae bacterium]
MKENINNLHRLTDLKKTLVEKNVSANAISSIEKALKKGITFSRAADLGLLNLSAADLSNLAMAVDFGPVKGTPNVRTFQFTFKPTANEEHFFGHQFVITYTNTDKFTIAESFPIEDSRLVYVDLDINNIENGTKVIYQVKNASGSFTKIITGNTNTEPKEEFIEFDKSSVVSTTIKVAVASLNLAQNPDISSSYQVKGKIIASANDKTEGYQVILMAATENTAEGNPDFVAVGFATTETNGYFVTGLLVFNHPSDAEKIIAAKAVVSKEDHIWERPVKLLEVFENDVRKSMIPQRLIIVISEAQGEESEDDCACKAGCNELNFHEKKVLEEYSYYTVVRTTEPSIIADTIEDEEEIDLDEIFGEATGIKVPLSVFRQYQASVKTLVKPIANFSITNANLNTVERAATEKATLASSLIKTTLNKDLLANLLIDRKISTAVKGKNKRQFKGRTYLNPLNQVDWDDEPTVYQAASIAHGHLLHFKQEWLPDGYSIGDLLYSLPLAPGQKKQIAVLDWERRESAANSQQLDYEEKLNNTLVRDRDISEVVSGTLNENIKANSSASTGGIGFGLGASVMGIIPGVGTFGSLLGISGGKSSSGSNATQNSHRDSTASSLQSINDRTSQAASVVRSQRSTVIQTVSQGERVEATSESVANYNHCHAVTIQYFEVLRHFNIQTRLAGVQECLFIPLQMSPFDLEKAKRWRNTLEKRLFKRPLLKGFDAIERVLHEKENSDNYYDSIGYPRKNYAEQAINFFSGELFIEFSFFNTNEGRLNEDIVKFFRLFGFQFDLDQYNDRNISNKELAELVGPRTIEFLLNALIIETDKGINLRLDTTLLNRFRQNAVLQVSLRQQSNTPAYIRRDQVDGIKIRLNKTMLTTNDAIDREAFEQLSNKFMKITVRSGTLRYRTENISGNLFTGSINNDLFADNDGVYIPTPLNGNELRNPRGEDIDAANKLLNHLNENLEHYHKCLWFEMTAERRYMLLDGIIAPGKANGRSVASVVENRLIGIAGNSLIMPVAPGNQLDPTIDENFDLFAQYYNENNDPSRMSLPTKGVYAEAVMGKCNSCEEKDESRFWRWEESPIPDSPNTQILPLNTDTRRADPGNLQAKDFPAPVVNIQNAPSAPDPTGLASMMQLIGKGDSFRDLTGLNQNQLNALSTFQKTMDTAQAFGKEAAELAKSAASMKMVEDAKKSGTISNDQAKEKGGAILDKLKDDPNASKLKESMSLLKQLEGDGTITAEEAKDAKANLLKNFLDSSNTKTPMSNEEISKLVDKVSGSDKELSVKRPDGETVEIKSGGGAGSNSINYTVPGTVDTILQESTQTCWAATTAIMLSWKAQASVSIINAVTAAGTAPDGETYLQKYNDNSSRSTCKLFAGRHTQPAERIWPVMGCQ